MKPLQRIQYKDTGANQMTGKDEYTKGTILGRDKANYLVKWDDMDGTVEHPIESSKEWEFIN